MAKIGAPQGLNANKFRSILTLLGVTIGVASIITMVSIILSVQQQIESAFTSFGSNLLVIIPGANPPAGGIRIVAGSNNTLTQQDARAILREVGGINLVAPGVKQSYLVVYSNHNWITSINGETPEFLDVLNRTIASGGFLTSKDVDCRARVAVLGQTVVTNLFGNADPVGKYIRINKEPFKVIGVLAEKGMSVMGNDQDDMIVVPLTTAQERLMGVTWLNYISAQAENSDVIYQAQDNIKNLLRIRHRLQPNDQDDFFVKNFVEIIKTDEQDATAMTKLLGWAAAISLLVGGIGIMNIMLVSVTERTQEIGIRKAVGATFSNILLQFLIEAMTVGIIGGLIGIIVGVGGGYTASYVAGWDLIISWVPIIRL